MFAYILRRLMLVVPTLIGIMVVNFFIIQAAPGGPVEQMLAQIQGTSVDATERFSGSTSGGEATGLGYAVVSSVIADLTRRGTSTTAIKTGNIDAGTLRKRGEK